MSAATPSRAAVRIYPIGAAALACLNADEELQFGNDRRSLQLTDAFSVLLTA